MAEPAPYRQTFFRLIGFLKPYKVSIVSIVLACGSQAAQIAIVWVVGGVINNAIQPKDSSLLRTYIIVIVALGVIKAGLMVARRLISGRQALAVEMDMRTALYERLVKLSFRFYDTHQTGQLMSRATVDLQGVRFFLGYGLIFFFQNILVVVSVTFILFFVQWELALLALAMVPFLTAIAYRYSRISHPTAPRRPAEARRRVDGRAGEHRRRPRREGVRPGAGRGGEVQEALRGRLRPDDQGEPAASLLRAADLVRAHGRAVGRAALRRTMVQNGTLSTGSSSRSTSTSPCSCCRCARSACGSARRSARPRRASGSSR